MAAASKDSADATRTLETVSDFWRMCLCAVSALSMAWLSSARASYKAPQSVSNGYEGGTFVEGKGNLGAGGQDIPMTSKVTSTTTVKGI